MKRFAPIRFRDRITKSLRVPSASGMAFKRRVNRRPEAIVDRVDVVLAKQTLKEKGQIPWAQAKKNLGLL